MNLTWCGGGGTCCMYLGTGTNKYLEVSADVVPRSKKRVSVPQGARVYIFSLLCNVAMLKFELS